VPSLSIVLPYKGRRDIDFALALATVTAMRELRLNPWIPLLYKSGVRWERDPVCQTPEVDGSCERFLSPLQVLKEGKVGDCDDVGPWRAAELRLGRRGLKRERATAKSVRSNIGWHIVVVRRNGRIEDPSKKLGMGKRG